MKTNYTILLLIIVTLISIKRQSCYCQPIQVKDMGGSIPSDFKVYNDKLYFCSSMNMNGEEELWVYDSKLPKSDTNPKQLVDLSDSTGPSFPNNLVIYANKLFFATNFGIYSYDDKAPISSTNPQKIFAHSTGLGVYNKLLYFASVINGDRIVCVYDSSKALNINNPRALYKTNPFADNRSEVRCRNSFTPCVYKGKMYFSAYDEDFYGGINDDEEIWVYDDKLPVSITNPQVLLNINTTRDMNTGEELGSYPYDFIVYKDKLYFDADDGNGPELWCYDNINTPHKAFDYNPINYASDPIFKTIYNNNLYFSAASNDYGTELWSYDGINEPVLIADIEPGAGIGFPAIKTVFADRLFFNEDNGINGRELWSYDCKKPVSETNPIMIYDLYPGKDDGLFYDGYMVVYNNSLYFGGYNGHYQGGLWALETNIKLKTAEQNVITCVNTDIVLSTDTLTGVPPYTYKWFKNDIPISNADFSDYKINKAQLIDNGDYKCIIQNDFSSATALFHVSVNSVPAFSLGKDTVIYVGDSILLSGPNNMTSYDWTTGAKTSNIYYKATYSNLGDNSIILNITANNICITSDTINITVWIKTILKTPECNIEACINSDIDLTTETVIGIPPFTYSWFKDDSPNTNTSTSVYKINKIQPNDKGVYKCIVKNQYSSVTATFNVAVNPTPVFNLGKDTVLNVGDSILLSGPNNMTSYNWSNGAKTSSIYFKATLLNLGNNNIILKVTDNNSCESGDTINIIVKVAEFVYNTSGVKETLLVFPNPAKDLVFIKHTNPVIVKIFNLTGQNILETKLNNSNSIDIKQLNAGLYILQATEMIKTYSIKLVIK